MNQLLVLDLDGTLLRNDKTVSDETVESLIEFKNRNNKILFATARFFGKAPTEIVDLTKLDMKTVYKVIICNKTPISHNFLTILPDTCKGVVTDNGQLCQIMNQEVSKWNSIQALMKTWNIKDEDIIAFGDDYNDLDMIKHAGIGVAMGNAEKVIKDAADFITDTNMNEGISKYLKENIL